MSNIMKYKGYWAKIEYSEEEIEESHIHEIIQVIDVPAIEAYDLVKVYINPIIITAILSIICMIILFYKKGIVKVVVTSENGKEKTLRFHIRTGEAL